MITPAMLHRRSFKYFLREICRQLHPGSPPLVLSWYLQAMCHALEQTLRGKTRRLVINAPPRSLKSITAAVAFSTWLLGRDPRARILVATHNKDLARLHDRQARAVMASPEYRAAFPATAIDPRRSRMLELRTTAGGFRLGVSTGGGANGFGGDFVILDDCMKAQDARSPARRERIEHWLRTTMGTRFDDPGAGTVIAIQPRLHERDLSGILLEEGATQLDLPAVAARRQRIPIGPERCHLRQPGELLDPARHSRESLRRLELLMGKRNYALQYLQDTATSAGSLLRLEWFARYDEVPPRAHCRGLIQSWDTAVSGEPGSAFSVCTTWGLCDGCWHLLDVFRRRLDYPDLRQAVIRLHAHWRPDEVLIENATAGPALFAELRRNGPFIPVLRDVRAGKEERLLAQTARIEAGLLALPNEAPWLDAFCRELLAAPEGRYWDQIDSMTQFLEFVAGSPA